MLFRQKSCILYALFGQKGCIIHDFGTKGDILNKCVISWTKIVYFFFDKRVMPLTKTVYFFEKRFISSKEIVYFWTNSAHFEILAGTLWLEGQAAKQI